MTPNSNKDNKDGNSKNKDKQQRRQKQQQRGVSFVNHAETIAPDDMFVPGMPPLRPRLPCLDTLLSDHVVSQGRGLLSTWRGLLSTLHGNT